MIYSQEFLKQLDTQKNRVIYARITSLTFDESPIESIEGRTTGGSINLDGSSAVRRSCSLTLVAQNLNYNEYNWTLKTKFKLEIGVENNIDTTYPKIIWFPQGIYVITSFNTARSTNNFTISISGKDKICLLNGEVSGSLESQVDFGAIEEEDQDGVWTIRKLPIQEIIKNAVHTYGGEPLHNIIINDLAEYGLELLEYRYDLPMYLYRKVDNNIYENALINGDKLCQVGDTKTVKALKDLTNNELETLVDSLIGSINPQNIYFDNDNTAYHVAKIEFGQTAGYRMTDLVYAGDLIANIGESLTSVLDKIKNMLGEFEYFYDLEGRFVFQKKKTFVNTLWTPIGKDEWREAAVLESMAASTSTAYTFNGGELITTFNNNPNIANMKNDYSIWGERTGISGSALPVHMRYAIDIKPKYYKSILVDDKNDDDTKIQLELYNIKYGTSIGGQESKEYNDKEFDWRELIYQMALDYYKYNFLDDFELRVAAANPQFPTGRTGYEQYYIDLQGFWRQLYKPGIQNSIKETTDKINVLINDKDGIIPSKKKQINQFQLTINEIKNELSSETPGDIQSLYDNLQMQYEALRIIQSQLVLDEKTLKELEIQLEALNEDRVNYREDFWHKNVFERPDQLDFWFDFLDTEGELSQFNVQTVGDRLKSVNDTNVKGIYFKETPDVIFVKDIAQEKDPAYRYIQVPDIDSMFSISAQGKSAKLKLDELIYQHGYCIESSTINTIPIYYLEPNTRIHLYDIDSGIDGDYIISKISLPLTYNGTMSLTATKATENLLY